MKRLWWWIVGGVTGVGLVVIVILVVAPKSPLPLEVQKQATSTLLVPKSSSAVINRDSAKYDKVDKLLTYNVAINGVRVVLSEQPTPEQFVDIPAVYSKLVDGLNNYLSFDVNVGTVHLTKPKELSGRQAAILNAKGTLLFAKPDADLSDDQWRNFFSHLEVQN